MDSPKLMYFIALTIGGAVGGYLPSLFGADIFSFWGVFGTAIGGFFGIWLVYKYVVGS